MWNFKQNMNFKIIQPNIASSPLSNIKATNGCICHVSCYTLQAETVDNGDLRDRPYAKKKNKTGQSTKGTHAFRFSRLCTVNRLFARNQYRIAKWSTLCYYKYAIKIHRFWPNGLDIPYICIVTLMAFVRLLQSLIFVQMANSLGKWFSIKCFRWKKNQPTSGHFVYVFIMFVLLKWFNAIQWLWPIQNACGLTNISILDMCNVKREKKFHRLKFKCLNAKCNATEIQCVRLFGKNHSKTHSRTQTTDSDCCCCCFTEVCSSMSQIKMYNDEVWVLQWKFRFCVRFKMY